MIKYQDRFVRLYDVYGNVYDKDLKMTERFTIVSKLFKESIEKLGNKITRMEWHGADKSYYFDYSKA